MGPVDLQVNMIRGVKIDQPAYTTIRSCDHCKRDIDVILDSIKSTLPTCYSVMVESEFFDSGKMDNNFCSLNCLILWANQQGKTSPGLLENAYPSYWKMTQGA